MESSLSLHFKFNNKGVLRKLVLPCLDVCLFINFLSIINAYSGRLVACGTAAMTASPVVSLDTSTSGNEQPHA